MENKRLELVYRDSNDELNIAGHKDISQENRMCSCQDDVVKKMGTLEDDGACGDSLSSGAKSSVIQGILASGG